jgi:5-methylcytosine-specific restriction endonuclease McrA
MAHSDEALNRIYDRTDGYCHLCCRKLSFHNYACYGARGAWEVEHSIARSRGGTDHPNNLYAACILCNREKSARTSRTVRSWNGRRKAPLSRARKAGVRRSNAKKGAAIGGFIGSSAGPLAALVCAAIGAQVGASFDPND